MYVKDSLKPKLDESANSSRTFGCLYRGLWCLLSYMPKYLRSCDVIKSVVLSDWVVKSKYDISDSCSLRN